MDCSELDRLQLCLLQIGQVTQLFHVFCFTDMVYHEARGQSHDVDCCIMALNVLAGGWGETVC